MLTKVHESRAFLTYVYPIPRIMSEIQWSRNILWINMRKTWSKVPEPTSKFIAFLKAPIYSQRWLHPQHNKEKIQWLIIPSHRDDCPFVFETKWYSRAYCINAGFYALLPTSLLHIWLLVKYLI